MRWAGTPELAALLTIEDPYAYRDRLTMPKFLINSAGDQYFLPDSSQFYFDALPEPDKHQAAVEILRRFASTIERDLPESTLVGVADELFRALDEEEAGHAQS